MRTLISNNSKYDKVIKGEAYFTADEYKGFELVNDQTKGNCLHCHTTDANALGTTTLFSNNGLSAAKTFDDYNDKGLAGVTHRINDVGKFKIPSFRNVSFTAPYMHDGRFNTLEEVLDFYSSGLNHSFNIDAKMEFSHSGGAHLSEQAKKQIIAFLLTLSDSTFINDAKFSDPFFTKHSQ